MALKKFTRRALPIAMAAIMVASCFPAMAATGTAVPADYSKTVLEEYDVTYIIDGEEVDATWYVDYYLEDMDNDYMTEAQYKNAKVNIYVPDGATADTPILYMVNNGSWFMDQYEKNTFLGATGSEYSTEDNIDSNIGRSAFCAKALDEGYIVVCAGLRNRNEGEKSPVTVADAKAVIRYLRDNNIGNTDRIFITGLSGGGALSVAIGSDGNSSDFYEDLYLMGAAGIEKSGDTYVSTINDDIFGVVAYCPITDLMNADGSYEYTYAGTRDSLYDQGYRADTLDQTFALSLDTLRLSPTLAANWATYVNELPLVTETGAALTAKFDTNELQASGTLYDGIEVLLVDCLQDALTNEFGGDADKFMAALAERTVGSSDGSVTYEAVVSVDDERNEVRESAKGAALSLDWITIENGKITAFDMEGYNEYVALGQLLKPAVAFTNKGLSFFAGLRYNENNLIGGENEGYGYISQIVFEESDLYAENGGAYASWEEYWAANGAAITLQDRMVNSIAYLVDDEGTDAGDSAPYWWVRHGSLDRDTSFANQTLLYYALINDKSIETVDFAFAFGYGHCGNYDLDDAMEFMAESLADADAKDAAANQPTTPDTTPTTPDTTPTTPDKAPQTGEASYAALLAVVVAFGAVAIVGTRRRELH